MRNRAFKGFVLLIGLLAFSASGAAEVFRCLDDDGKLKFSDRPCDEGEAESTVEIEIEQPLPAVSNESDSLSGDMSESFSESQAESESENGQQNAAPTDTPADLIDATRRGEALLVKTLIGRGVDVNGRDNLGYTALHMAGLKRGTVQVARFLVEAGADVNAKTPNGYSVLARSIYNLPVATYLVDNGADVNAVDRNGSSSVLHTAVSDPVTDDGVIELLIDNDANLEAVNSLGETPLHSAVWRADDPLKTARLLLDRGAFVNPRNNKGETPLDVARTRSRQSVREELIKLLESYGAR